MHIINGSDNNIEIILYILAGLVLLTAVGLLVTAYILPRISYYSVAKRRMLRNSWLAWLPIGDAYILGSISDRYRFMLTGKQSRHHIVLTVTETINVILKLAAIACLSFSLCGAFIYLISIIGSIGLVLMNEDFRRETDQIFAICCIVLQLMCTISVLRTIIRSKSLYDFYRSCRPKISTVFLVLSILFPVTVPIFTFLCRNADNGMPKPEGEVPLLETQDDNNAFP